MSYYAKLLMAVSASVMIGGCTQKESGKPGSYGYDVDFFRKHNIEFVELTGEDSLSKVLIAPGYQGRVMTSTAGGHEGDSYGWINYRFIASGTTDAQFNPVGGEERFWLGPEGGPFSLYFKKGEQQVFENWHVPPVIDTQTFDIAENNSAQVKFTKNAVLSNAQGTTFNVGIERTISLLKRDMVAALLKTDIPADLKIIAYQSDNTITNKGELEWNKKDGLISVWILGMFNPTPTTTVFIPYKTDAEGVIVNDEYFGKVPSDRLIPEEGMIYFKIDGKYRSKIGIPVARAKELCGSYDTEKKLLTLVWYNLPSQPQSYLNGQWGEQKDAFNGDVVNSYNDGPVADGSVMGPFYEIETSSPGAALKPGESLTHIQRVMHIQGQEIQIAQIVRTLFNVDLSEIASRFR